MAEEIGYPVLLKAAKGGGGKGMRAVRSAGELDKALRLTRGEAESATEIPSWFPVNVPRLTTGAPPLWQLKPAFVRLVNAQSSTTTELLKQSSPVPTT